MSDYLCCRVVFVGNTCSAAKENEEKGGESNWKAISASGNYPRGKRGGWGTKRDTTCMLETVSRSLPVLSPSLHALLPRRFLRKSQHTADCRPASILLWDSRKSATALALFSSLFPKEHRCSKECRTRIKSQPQRCGRWIFRFPLACEPFRNK